MILLTHILIAISSVFYTMYSLFTPSIKKLTICYSLITLTIISGVLLVVLKPAHMQQACVTGLVYVGFMMLGIFALKHKLNKRPESSFLN